VYSLSFVFRSFVAVHIAKLTKEMNFKLQMKLQIPSTIIGAIVGVGMAYTGYGIWSLVWLNLTQAIAFTIQNWIFIKWRPSFVFNKESFIYHFSFGYKMTLSGLLDTVYKNAYNIIIGKFFSPTIVGFYNQAETMRLLPVKQITTVMGKVTYPLFSSIDNDVQLKAVYQASMKLVLFIVIPIMFTLTIIAKELFIFLFGAKWIPAVPYFQILAFASIVRPISTYNLNILKVKGRSDVFLKLEIIKKSIGIMAIAVALPYGVMALTISLTVVSYLSLFADMWYSGKFINYSMREQFKDISKLFLIGVLLLGICYVLKLNIIPYVESGFLLILLISLIYAALYLTAILIFEKDMIKIINNLIRK
jgi:O-antigen/teichoic acid export membrane protein